MEETMPDVISQLSDDNRNVRRHGNTLLAIADYSAAIPTTFFGSDGLPNALPTGYKNMGYITTDGVKIPTDIATDLSTMLQDTEPVRSTSTGFTRTLQVGFGESNAWTKGLAHKQPVSAWASDKNAEWSYDDGDGSEWPYYRILLLSQDGLGDSAVYRVEFAYRAQVTALDDRTLSRGDDETTNPTFTCFRDPVVGKSYTEASTPSTGVVAAAQGGSGS
jgi:hypothetical protein